MEGIPPQCTTVAREKKTHRGENQREAAAPPERRLERWRRPSRALRSDDTHVFISLPQARVSAPFRAHYANRITFATHTLVCVRVCAPCRHRRLIPSLWPVVMATLLYIALKEAERVWHQSRRFFAWNGFWKKKHHKVQAKRGSCQRAQHGRVCACVRVWVQCVCRSNALSGTSLGSGGVAQQQRANRWVFITVSCAAVPSWQHKLACAPNSAGGQTVSYERHGQQHRRCEPGSKKDLLFDFILSFLQLLGFLSFFFLVRPAMLLIKRSRQTQCWWVSQWFKLVSRRKKLTEKKWNNITKSLFFSSDICRFVKLEKICFFWSCCFLNFKIPIIICCLANRLTPAVQFVHNLS